MMPEPGAINCTINGIACELISGFTLSDFLESKNIPAGAVVVERNGTILPKGTYQDIILCDSDRLEIVQIIGGG
jgi:thiamine biosynthesis protein ThiS